MTSLADERPQAPLSFQPLKNSVASDVLDLLASMRFAISLLTIICVASAIGTVLQQGQALVAYVDAFGPFWAEVFGALGLFQIYSSGWFLVILAFLVVSTSLCITRNTPRILADFRTLKEGLRVKALDAFHHRAHSVVPGAVEDHTERVLQALAQAGWQVRRQDRLAEGRTGAGTMIAARRGAVNKLGYIAAHSAIVLVCVGGLFDGEMVTKVQMAVQGLVPFRSGELTERNRLSVDNPAYRANLMVPEGQRSSSAVLNLEKGMLLQPLPFDVELRRFIVDYYATGMPKRFASEIVVHDPADRSTHAATVEVNKPFVYKGVTIFQSSFEDGGSVVKLRAQSLLTGASQGMEAMSVVVGGPAQPVPAGLAGRALSLELTGLRAINVEDLSKAEGGGSAAPGSPPGGTDARAVKQDTFSQHLGSGAKGAGDKRLTNIGPSVTYKLRDASGQAFEFQNFMVPVNLGEQSVYLLGVRTSPGAPFRFLRIPADGGMTMDDWLRMRRALSSPPLRAKAVQAFVAQGPGQSSRDMAAELSLTAQRVLELFAGDGPVSASAEREAGFQALSSFVEAAVPEAQREQTASTLIRVLNGALFELLNVARVQDGLAPLSPEDDKTRAFMTQAVLSLSDANAYPVPVVFMPESFDQKQASVFQVTRTPGRNVVYLGCVLLIVGVFAMLYVRERRLWVWLQRQDGRPEGEGGAQGGTHIKMALSSTRQTLDTDVEFDQLSRVLLPGFVPAESAPEKALS